MSLNFGFNVGVILHSRPDVEISFKFIPKILMSKECIHFFGPLCRMQRVRLGFVVGVSFRLWYP